MRKSKNVRRISLRRTPKVLKRETKLESARSEPGDELDGGIVARLGSGSENGQMRGRSGDLRGVQSAGRVVDLRGYRTAPELKTEIDLRISDMTGRLKKA